MGISTKSGFFWFFFRGATILSHSKLIISTWCRPKWRRAEKKNTYKLSDWVHINSHAFTNKKQISQRIKYQVATLFLSLELCSSTNKQHHITVKWQVSISKWPEMMGISRIYHPHFWEINIKWHLCWIYPSPIEKGINLVVTVAGYGGESKVCVIWGQKRILHSFPNMCVFALPKNLLLHVVVKHLFLFRLTYWVQQQQHLQILSN